MWRFLIVVLAMTAMAQGPATISRASAEADALTFAMGVAAAGYPSGFILPNSERQGAYVPPDKGDRLALDEAVKVFLARHPDYEATFDGNALLVRHAKVPADIMAALRLAQARPGSKQPVSRALFDVLRQLARQPVGGVIGSGPVPAPTCPTEQVVSLPAGRSSTIQTLNGVAMQAKGMAWLVRFGAPGETLRLQVGYVCGDGMWSALSVPGW